MIASEDTSYNLRKRKSKWKDYPAELNVAKKRLKGFDHISKLPNETMLNIFSFLDAEDLYHNVRGVCKKWRQLSMLSSSWRSVRVDNEVPTQVLLHWINLSPVIKHLKITNRKDTEIILDALSKHASHLETLTIENCWGSLRKIWIRSTILCNLVTRCKKLQKIILERVKIRSCRFFNLLAKKRRNGKFENLRYIGPITDKQFDTFSDSWPGAVYTDFFDFLELCN